MEDTEKESYIENYPIPITIEGTQLILKQMENTICKIYKNNGDKGTGFFCYIPYKDTKIPVFMTNNHIIDENYIKNNKKINLTLNDDKINKVIKIENNRIIYSSKLYDTTIIEIDPLIDKIDNFLELESNIFKEESEKYHGNESVYILQYPQSQKVAVSYGIIKNVLDYDIKHVCCTEKGSSGSPILSILSQKVIGIHKGGKNHFNVNKGTFLKNPINEFIIKYNKNKYSDYKNSLNTEEKINNIESQFSSSPCIGLTKIGHNCFFNAFIQCLCHIKQFINFFKYNEQIIILTQNNKNKNSLSSSFKLLIEKLWPNQYNSLSNNNNYFNPQKFKQKIINMNSSYDLPNGSTLKNLIISIITTLHEELNRVKNNNYINNKVEIDQSNMNEVFKSYGENFISTNKSIISDIFYFSVLTQTNCTNCNIITYNFETHFFLSFSINLIIEFKNQNNYYYNINNEITLYECLDFYKKIDFMSSSNNNFYCNYCKMNSNYAKMTEISTGPSIFIFLFYYKNEIKQKDKIKFEKDLNLYNYIKFQETGYNYKLIGIITYNGKVGMGGHYIAYCSDPISNEWYKYDNEKINKINIIQLVDINSLITNYNMPYILFYKKI